MKLKRGQKLCKKCKQITAARQRICKWCDHEFVLTNKKIKGEITNWKDLKRGDIFRVVNGTGPYYVLNRSCGEGEAGDRLFMGAIGKYIVKGITDTGIDAWNVTKLGTSGYTFVYMGKPDYCEKLNIHRRPHRIVKINIKR